MALLCEHGEPLNYDDNNNDGQQHLGVYANRYGKTLQWCFLIKPDNLGNTNLYDNPIDEAKWYNDKTSGVRVRPGYHLTLYTDTGNKGDSIEYDSGNWWLEGIPTMRDSISSVNLKKNCNTGEMTWDNSCYNPTDTNKYIGNNRQNRINTCSNNLAAHSRCKDWCITNRSECSNAIGNFCNNNVHIDSLNNEQICSDIKNSIIKEKCTKNYSLFATNACKNYCKNNPEECQESVQKYCQNNFDQTCKDFCTTDNIKFCKSAIKKYCKSKDIKFDTYCQNTLIHPSMRGEYDQEMQYYCNNQGKQINLDIVKTGSANKSATIKDELENPICACYDEGLIDAKFSQITKPDLKTAFTSRPQCFYYNCINDPNAYKKPVGDCNITICNMDLGEVDIKNSSNIKIENNCGQTGLTNSPPAADGSPSNGPNSANKIDCQMSEWTPCSKKCSEGIQTRDKIVDPLNGGKPCGTIIQTCKTPCTSLQEQLQNSTFNYADLDQNNKNIFIFIVVVIVVVLFIIK